MTKFDKTKLYTSVYELSLHENIIDGPQWNLKIMKWKDAQKKTK